METSPYICIKILGGYETVHETQKKVFMAFVGGK